MPELPDVTLYIEALTERLVGQSLKELRIASPFLLQTVEPPVNALEGKVVTGFQRVGKQIIWGFEEDLFVAVHLMIAGRFKWKKPGVAIPRKLGLCAFDFEAASVLLTEAGTKKRAQLWVLQGQAAVDALDRGGIDVMTCSFEAFKEGLMRENHTLKRSLTDPRLYSGIGNAYSDEILHRAKLSPLKMSTKLKDEEIQTLLDAVRSSMTEWIENLRAEFGGKFPEKVTAFRPGMAVHGKYGEPCPVCNSPVQRIVYSSNETNYCATCQTGGKLLADRAMSRLLKKDWPRRLEDLEDRR